MPEQLLTILKICLLALLYLFFFRVVRAVWAEVRSPPASATAPHTLDPKGRQGIPGRRRPQAPTKLVVVEPSTAAGSSCRLLPDTTIGRADDCTLVIEDQYASQVHTRVFASDGSWCVEDLGSTNGTYVNRRKVTGPTVVHRGDRIQLGNVVVEVR